METGQGTVMGQSIEQSPNFRRITTHRAPENGPREACKGNDALRDAVGEPDEMGRRHYVRFVQGKMICFGVRRYAENKILGAAFRVQI